MGQVGKYNIPKEMKDEDRWLKFFTKRQLLYIAGALLICVPLIKFSLGIPVIFTCIIWTVVILFVAVVAAICMVNMPVDKYLFGGGIKLETLFLRVVRKMIKKNKIIYVKHYKDGREEEKDKDKKRWGL